jgi:hypothetical protein
MDARPPVTWPRLLIATPGALPRHELRMNALDLGRSIVFAVPPKRLGPYGREEYQIKPLLCGDYLGLMIEVPSESSIWERAIAHTGPFLEEKSP